MVIHHGNCSVRVSFGDQRYIDQSRETAEEIGTAGDDDREERRYDCSGRDSLLRLDRVELLDHLRKSPGSQRCQNNDIQKTDRVRAEERRERALLPHCNRVVRRDLRQLADRAHEAAVAVKNGQNDDHDTDQHDDALHEIIVDRRRIAAHKDVYAGEDRHHAYAVDVRDTEGHLEQVGEAVVDRCCVRNQENENDGRSNDLERFRVISALKVSRHGC